MTWARPSSGSPRDKASVWFATTSGTPSGQPSSFAVTLKPNGIEELPSYPLRDYRLAWELCDQSGKLLASGEQAVPEVNAAQTISGKMGAVPEATFLKLHVTLLRPGGIIAAESSVDWGIGAGAAQPAAHAGAGESQPR